MTMTTKHNQSTATTFTASRRRRDAGGSALVLAIVTIVMMVMLGAAYLQMARIDRRTAAAVDTRSNVDEASILRYIGWVLAGDVPIGIDSGNDDNEFYDYPWTADAVGNPASGATLSPGQRLADRLWLIEDRFAPLAIPGPRPDFDQGDLPAREPRQASALPDAAGNYYAEGNVRDDPWLASNDPEPYPAGVPAHGRAGVLTWPHATNLMGLFIDLNELNFAADPATGSGMYPPQYLSTTTNDPSSENELLFSGDAWTVPAIATGSMNLTEQGLFADADGDGIVDSRWTWAPLPSDGGLAYVMAVRIIDNSALLDVNTLAFSRSTGGDPNQPRWMWPGELDLESGLTAVRTSAGTGALNADDILNFREVTRNDGGPAGGGGTHTFFDRMYNWLDASAVWRQVNKSDDIRNNPAPDVNLWRYLGTDLEQEEARTGTTGVAGGEDTDPAAPANPIAAADYKRFRASQDELELRWRGGLNRALPDNSGPENDTPIETRDSTLFRSGATEVVFGPPAPNGTPYGTSEANFFDREPRRKLSVITGSGTHARVDINEAADYETNSNQLNTTDDLDDLADVFRASVPAVPGVGRLQDGAAWVTEEDFADQAAALTRDFIDTDSILTRRGDHYGMEYLPFVSEVYLQPRYTASTVKLASDAPITVHDQVTWTHVTGDYAAAIEIVNPWPWTIEMPDVELFVDSGAGGAAVSWGTLDALTGGKATMTANEVIILRRLDPAGGIGASENGELPNGTTATEFNVTGGDWPVDAVGPTQVEVRLEAATNRGTQRVAYQRFEVDDITSTLNSFYTDANTDVSLNDAGFLQSSYFGTGNGLNALTVRAADVVPEAHPAPVGSYEGGAFVQPDDPQPMATLYEFNTPSKGKNSDDLGDALDTRVVDTPDAGAAAAAVDEPWVIGNAGRLYRTGDLLRLVLLGPRREAGNDVTVAEVWKEVFDRSTAADYGAPIVQEYKIANLMFDPADGMAPLNATVAGTDMSHAEYYLTAFTTLRVNKGKGGLVAGRPNINTMRPSTLASLLPTTNPVAAATIAVDIDNARRDLTTLDANLPSDIRGIPFAALLARSTNVYDPATPGLVGEVVDFNELDPGVGGPDPTHAADGYTQDREEQTMLLNYLNQVVSTRSDIYTAYVLVRAYPADDFTNGGTAPGYVDEFRLIAVFDRSEEGFPRILAVRRFSDAP